MNTRHGVNKKEREMLRQELFFEGSKEYYRLEMQRELSELINMESDLIDTVVLNDTVDMDLDQLVQKIG